MAMGRGDQDKRLRRAGEQVDKALARRELESAVEAVLGLDKDAREPLLALVAPAFRRTLLELHKTSAWARLHTLAARSEQEPRLLLCGADEAAVASARWPLLLACMRARDFGRATRIWKSLIDPVTARAPALARAMATWIAGQGQLGLDAVVDLNLDGLPALSATDPRLGTQSPGRARVAPPPAPTSVEQVEGALYALFATQPLTVVADTLRGWLERAPVDVARALRTRAGSLALRELLIQADAKESLALPATVLARLCEGAEDDLASELLLATRLLVTTVGCNTPRAGEAESLAALAGALVRTRQMGEVAATLAGDFGGMPELAPTALAICQGALVRATLLPDEPFFLLWTAALVLCAKASENDPEDDVAVAGPAWLQTASREACKRGSALATYLDQRPALVRAKLLDDLVWGQPADVVADLIDALWNDASEPLRRDLSALVPDLIEDAEDAGMHALERSHSLRDLATYDRIAGRAQAADPSLPFLALGGLTFWRRFGIRSLPYCVRLLPYALSQANPGQRLEVVQSQIGNRVDIEAWLDAIRELCIGDPEARSSLVEQIAQMMFDRFRDDRTALARALARAERFDAPFALIKRLGHAYQRAALAQEIDGAESTPEDRRAREILALLFGGTTKKRPARLPAKTRNKTKSRSPGPGDQLALPLGEQGEDEP